MPDRAGRPVSAPVPIRRVTGAAEAGEPVAGRVGAGDDLEASLDVVARSRRPGELACVILRALAPWPLTLRAVRSVLERVTASPPVASHPRGRLAVDDELDDAGPEDPCYGPPLPRRPR